MKFDYANRVKAGIILIALFALLSNLRLLTETAQFDLSFVGQDEVSLYQKRFDDVKKMLPQNGVIGFVSSNRNPSLDFQSTDSEGLREWYLAQYALAPVILSPTPGHKITLINDKPGDRDPESEDERGQKTRNWGGAKVVDFGNGVKLLGR